MGRAVVSTDGVREGAGRAAEAEELLPSGGAENIGALVFAPMGWRWKI